MSWLGKREIRAVVAMAVGGGVRIYKLVWNDLGILTSGVDSVQLAVDSGQVPRVFIPSADSASDRHAFVTLGTDGLFRRVVWGDGSGMSSQAYPAPQESFIVTGGNYIGTESGNIFAYTGSSNLRSIGQPHSGAVRLVDSTGAQYVDGTLRNSASRLDLQSPNGLGPGIVSGGSKRFYSYDFRYPLEFTLVMSDSEANFPPLRIYPLNGTDTLKLTSDFQWSWPESGFEGKLPIDGCDATGKCLMGFHSRMTGKLFADSLRLSFPIV